MSPQDFLKELVALYDKYGLAISHEDTQGSFIITNNSQDLREWMMNARIEIILEEEK